MMSLLVATQVAHDPRILIPFSHEGDTDEMRVQDASAFAEEGEELSFWELMVRFTPCESFLCSI